MSDRPLLRAWAWTAAGLAALHVVAFALLYLRYRIHAGQWFADLPLVIFSWPFVASMTLLTGGDFDYAGDMTARVAAAALVDTALVYLGGWVLEISARALVGALRARRPV